MLNGWRLLKYGEALMEFSPFCPVGIGCFLLHEGCGGYRNRLPEKVGRELAVPLLYKAFNSDL